MLSEPYFNGALDRVLHLQTVPLFTGLDAGHVAALTRDSTEQLLGRGEALLDPSRAADSFWVVIEGRVAVRDATGRPSLAGAGDTVGFLALLARQGGGSARAEVDSVVLRLEWEAYLDICEQHFPILEHHLRFLAGSILRRGGASRPPAKAAPTQGQQPFDLVDRILCLRTAPTLPRDSLDALSELARHVKEVRVPADTSLWRRGEIADYFLQVAEGLVVGRGEDPLVSVEAGPGGSAGLYGALADGRRWYDAVAARATVALRIDMAPFLDILEDHFDTAREFAGLLAATALDPFPANTNRS